MIGVHLEPMITELIGIPTGQISPDQLGMPAWRKTPAYFFSPDQRDIWAPDLRRMILRRTQAQVKLEAKVRNPLVVIKEPNGTQAAEALLALLPGSRMIFLVRDGRDAIDSELAAATSGGWAARAFGTEVTDRMKFIRDRAHVWAWRTAAAERAYASSPPSRRYLVRYEDLRASPVPALDAVGAWMGLEGDWAAAADALAFEKVEGRGANKVRPIRLARCVARESQLRRAGATQRTHRPSARRARILLDLGPVRRDERERVVDRIDGGQR